MNRKYSVEMREPVLRMFDEVRPEHVSLMAVIRHAAGMLGMSPETLRVWIRRRQVDAGYRAAVTTDAAADVERLQRENFVGLTGFEPATP